MNYFLRLFIGISLILSGILQQYNIEVFEVRMFELFNLKWTVIPFFTRILIALELYLGLTFVLNVNPKKWNTYLLTVFVVYVVYDMIWDVFVNSNHYYLQIKPIYKYVGPSFVYYKVVFTVVLIAFLVYEYKKGGSTDFKWKWLKFIFPVPGLAFVFIYNAFFLSDLNIVEAERKTDVDLVAINEKLQTGFNKFNLDGNRILMFVSVGCPHCFETTKKVAAIKRRNPNLQVDLILHKTDKIDIFQKYANSDFNYKEVTAPVFSSVIMGTVPRILYVKDGKIEKQWDGGAFNYGALNFLMELR